jgi:hypothetical protein
VAVAQELAAVLVALVLQLKEELAAVSAALAIELVSADSLALALATAAAAAIVAEFPDIKDATSRQTNID